jgi:hypothetical protein
MRVKVNKLGLLLLGFFLAASQANAAREMEGVFFGPSFLYQVDKDQDGNNSSNDSEIVQTNIDLKAGYIMMGGLFLGVTHSTETVDYGTTELARTSYGPSVGVIYNNLALHLTYYMGLEQELGSSNKRTGSGMQLDLGYYFHLGSSVVLGPQLSYRQFKYDELESGATTTEIDHTHTDIDPMIILAFSI